MLREKLSADCQTRFFDEVFHWRLTDCFMFLLECLAPSFDLLDGIVLDDGRFIFNSKIEYVKKFIELGMNPNIKLGKDETLLQAWCDWFGASIDSPTHDNLVQLVKMGANPYMKGSPNSKSCEEILGSELFFPLKDAWVPVPEFKVAESRL